MKRNEIVNNLIKEGFSEKTLVRFSDKQLVTLSERVFGEQTVTTVPPHKKETYLKNDPKQIAALNNKLKNISQNPNVNDLKNTEIAVAEDKDVDEAARTMANGYHGGLKKMRYKAGSKAKCVPPTTKKKKKLSESNSELNAKRNLHFELKEAGVSDHDIENVDINELGNKYSKKHQGVKDAHDLYKRINGKDMSLEKQSSGIVNETKKWLQKIIENNYHSRTTKNEIMGMITAKLTEQETAQFGPKVKKGHNGIPEFMTYDAITSAEPATKPSPGTKPSPTIAPDKPDPRIKPKTPYQPGPGPNPRPKAGVKTVTQKKV
jgi:hypothetical protein